MITEHIARWTRGQREQFQLCELIERTADRLPIHDTQQIGRIAETLRATLKQIHSFEEDMLFPALKSLSPQMAPMLESFVHHHAFDLEIVADICTRIRGLPEATASDVKELKFRMRSFSESLRRHTQFEEAICRALFASRGRDAERVVQ